jgi:hypothetical protein
MQKYFTGLDRAAAGLNPFMAVIAIGLAMVDLTLAVDRLRSFQAAVPTPDVAGLMQDEPGRPSVSSIELLGTTGFN